MNVYVDEIPNDCDSCIFCNNKGRCILNNTFYCPLILHTEEKKADDKNE